MYDKNLLSELLTNIKYKCINDEGNVLPPSNPVYTQISAEMALKGSKISPKHIYTILKTNRNRIHTIVLQSFDTIQRSETLVDESNATDEQPTLDPPRVFQIVISHQSWDEIKPVSKKYGTRRYVKMKPGIWTHVIAEKIWDQARLPCAFSFKTGKVSLSLNAGRFAYFEASCKECGASLIGKMFTIPQKNKDCVFECTLSNFDAKLTHIRKRQLKGYLREKVAGKLVDGHKDATVWRTEEAKRLMRVGDTVPPILHNAEVLRKAKQEEADKRLNLVCNDPIQNLYHAKYNQCIHAIHAIGMDPFYCMYWSREQLEFFKIQQREPDSNFLIDASGGFAKKLICPNDNLSPHLFLYQCVSVSNGKSVPVFQMLSAKQNAALITFFLLEIQRAGAPIPRVVISDLGRAILVAVSRAFANCRDLKHYLQACYDVAVKRVNNVLPSCYLRLDVSHFIALVARWECLRHKPTKVRQFYIRCMAQAYKMTCLDELSQLLLSVMVVALSEEIGRDGKGEHTSSETYLRHANNTIKGVVIEDEDIACDSDNDRDRDEDLEFEDTAQSWVELGNSIFEKAKDVALFFENGDVLSAYYNVQAADKIKSLITYLPLCTGVMRPYFNRGSEVATSSAVEATFSDYKNRAFKGSLPMRVDKFIIKHIDYLEGKLLLACAGNKIIGNDRSKQSLAISTNLESHSEAEHTSCSTLELSSYVSNGEQENLNYFSAHNVDANSTSIEDFEVSSHTMNNGERETEDLNLLSVDDADAISESIQDPVKTLSCMQNNNGKLLNSAVHDISYTSTTQAIDEPSSLAEVSAENSKNDLNARENWRGLGEKGATKSRKDNVRDHLPSKKLKRKQPYYLEPCPDWDFVNSVSTIGIPVMKNDLLCDPVKLEGKTVTVRYTCAFDSLVHTVAHVSAMYPVDDTWSSESNQFMDLVRGILSRGKITAKDYCARAILLIATNLFQITSFTRKLHMLNAYCNVARLAERLFNNYPSYRTSKTCPTCKSTIVRNESNLNVNVNILLRKGFGSMQESIDDVVSSGDTCSSLCAVTREYGPRVIIDTSIVTDNNYKKFLNLLFTQQKLDGIAKSLVLDGKSYTLRGVVHYIIPKEHYVALVYTGLHWYVYDDLPAKKFITEPTCDVVPHVLVYARN